jgi:hypothetical protein
MHAHTVSYIFLYSPSKINANPLPTENSIINTRKHCRFTPPYHMPAGVKLNPKPKPETENTAGAHVLPHARRSEAIYRTVRRDVYHRRQGPEEVIQPCVSSVYFSRSPGQAPYWAKPACVATRTAVAFVRKCKTVTVQTRSRQQRQFAVIQTFLGVPRGMPRASLLGQMRPNIWSKKT